MIVVTVGTQLPFDRLIAMIDEIAPELGEEIFAQTGVGTYEPKNIKSSPTISPASFDAMLKEARLIIAHAGIGTVLKAYKYVKPIILVPRRASFGEHRNDHQLATVSQLRGRPGIHIAESKEELTDLLKRTLAPAMPAETSDAARERLRAFVRSEVAFAKSRRSAGVHGFK